MIWKYITTKDHHILLKCDKITSEKVLCMHYERYTLFHN